MLIYVIAFISCLSEVDRELMSSRVDVQWSYQCNIKW